MINTTYLTVGEIHIKTYQELACSPSFAGGLQQQSIYLVLLNMVLSLTIFLILVALQKECPLHPPSKLSCRCLTSSDLSVGLITQPLSMLLIGC